MNDALTAHIDACVDGKAPFSLTFKPGDGWSASVGEGKAAVAASGETAIAAAAALLTKLREAAAAG